VHEEQVVAAQGVVCLDAPVADHEQVRVLRLERIRRRHEALAALLELGEEAAHAVVAAVHAAVVGDELHLGIEQRNRLLRSLLPVGGPQLVHGV
jgi:hypothetical protein